jgi:hypothetical protein
MKFNLNKNAIEKGRYLVALSNRKLTKNDIEKIKQFKISQLLNNKSYQY